MYIMYIYSLYIDARCFHDAFIVPNTAGTGTATGTKTNTNTPRVNEVVAPMTPNEFSNMFMCSINTAILIMNRYSVAEFCQEESLFHSYMYPLSTSTTTSPHVNHTKPQQYQSNKISAASSHSHVSQSSHHATLIREDLEKLNFTGFVFVLFTLANKVRNI